MKEFAFGAAFALALGFAHAAPVSYLGTLSDGVTVFDDVPIESYGYAAEWDFWRFNGTAGDLVTISVNRASDQMDPGVALYFGLGGDTAGLSMPYSMPGTDSDDGFLTYLTQDDDSGGDAPIAGPFSNALIASFQLPTTGTYTIGVFDVLGACNAYDNVFPDGPDGLPKVVCNDGGPWTYALTASGFTSQVPEPGVLALLAVGLLGAGAAARRKARG